MLRSCAVAFQSIRKSLVEETRLKTLDLYRSLLRSSEKYQHAQVLQGVIRDRFKQNKYNTSRPKVLELLSEADQTRQLLENGSLDNQCVVQNKINTYIEQHQKRNIRPQKQDVPSKKEKKQTMRKPYQVAILTQHSSGYRFKRVRGWVQPVQTAMMFKNRVKTNQTRLDKLFEYKSQIEMIRSERLFLATLDCLPSDKLYDMENSIKAAMNENNEYYYNAKKLMDSGHKK